MASIKKLQDMANVLRRDSIEMTTKAGSGHPTSCMSCAEIVSTLFFNEMSYDIKNPFNPDNDEFILSKGHAAPILYAALKRAGCIKNDLLTLRKINSSLEGHPMPRSLDWIKVASGSLGQGLSIGVGMALAAKLQKRDFKTYVLMGDSEIAEGSVYEAMQLANNYGLDNLIGIVDVNRLGQRGETMLGHNLKAYKKRCESFGWKTYTIDGHNIKALQKVLRKSVKIGKPTMILAKTYKGHGFSLIENKEGWHGKPLSKTEKDIALTVMPNPKIPNFKIKKPNKIKTKQKTFEFEPLIYDFGKKVSTRKAYGNVLKSLAKSNEKIIALDAEVSNSTYSESVKEETPNQFIECFIAEQNMAGMALGLEKKGFTVFASTFAAFLTRAHDQIRMSAISTPNNLTFCGSHSGCSIGEDGASQMALEDLSMFRALPGSFVLYPSDAVSTEKLTILASKLKGLKYIRTTRANTPIIYDEKESFKLGEFKALKASKKDRLVLAGSGITLHECLKASEKLKNVAVVDLYCIKPFKGKLFKEFVNLHGKKLIVVEDHYPEGGIGEMIKGELAGSQIKIKHLCVTKIPHSGTPKQVLRKNGIDYESIIKASKKF